VGGAGDRGRRAHRRIVILPLIAEEGVQTDLLDLALGIFIADPWTFEDRLDTVAGAILGSAARKDRDFDLLKKHLGEIGREAPELRGLIEQFANTDEHYDLDLLEAAIETIPREAIVLDD
jgi:hypothetical protein